MCLTWLVEQMNNEQIIALIFFIFFLQMPSHVFREYCIFYKPLLILKK